MRIKSIGGFISGLLGARGPSAIHWPFHRSTLFALAAGIVAIIVDSINGHQRRWVSYVSPKSDYISPSLAKFNPAPSVAVEFCTGGVIATSFNSAPYAINSGSLSLPIKPMNSSVNGSQFSLQASAACAVSVSEIRRRNFASRSAIAHAPPQGRPAPCVQSSKPFNHEKTTKALPYQIHFDFFATRHLSAFASTRFCSSLAQGEPVDGFYRAAFADTLPDSISMDVPSNLPYRSEVSEGLPRKVFCPPMRSGSENLGFIHSNVCVDSSGAPVLNTPEPRAFSMATHKGGQR